MDSMGRAVAAGTVDNYRQTLLRLHKIDIARHRGHFVVLDFAADTMDASDIVHLDLDTVTAMIEHTLVRHMDSVSDNCRMQTKKLVAVGAHNMAADMEVVHSMVMVALKVVSTDTNSNVRLRALIFRLHALPLWPHFLICWLNGRFCLSHALMFPWNGRIAGKRMLVFRMSQDYFEWVPLTIAMNDCCATVHFGCTSALTAQMMLMCRPVCGRQSSNRFEKMQMSFGMRRCWFHCMQTAGWIRMG